MKKRVWLVLFFWITISTVFAQANNNNFSPIVIDTVSFEDNGYLHVLDKDGNTLVMFKRYENTSIQGMNIKNARIYDKSGNLIMTIVINFKGQELQLHLQDYDKKRALIEITSKLETHKIKSDIKVDYFTKNYTMTHEIKNNSKFIGIYRTVLLDGLVIIKTKDEVKTSGEVESTFEIENNYLLNNQTDAGIWSIILLLFKELGR